MRPGGAAFDLTAAMADEMRQRLKRLREELEPVLTLMFESASVQARLEGVGVVPRAACTEYGFVGPVARACELPRDVRHDHPWGIFRFAHIPVATMWAGDVFARAMVRRLEIERSLEFTIEQLVVLPEGSGAGGLRATARERSLA